MEGLVRQSPRAALPPVGLAPWNLEERMLVWVGGVACGVGVRRLTVLGRMDESPAAGSCCGAGDGCRCDLLLSDALYSVRQAALVGENGG